MAFNPLLESFVLLADLLVQMLAVEEPLCAVVDVDCGLAKLIRQLLSRSRDAKPLRLMLTHLAYMRHLGCVAMIFL